MDIVKKKIDELQGEINIESESGKGTTVTVELPVYTKDRQDESDYC